jgi:hypothetical protein
VGRAVVVVVVVLVVDVVFDVEAWREIVLEAAWWESPPSSRPWNTSADAEATATATTSRPPITHARFPNRPIRRRSAPEGRALRS